MTLQDSCDTLYKSTRQLVFKIEENRCAVTGAAATGWEDKKCQPPGGDRCFLVGDGGFTPAGHKLRLHRSPPKKYPRRSNDRREYLVGDGGFEPPKALPADLQSVPFGHSGNPPYTIWNWSWWTDSNPRPADYKSAALPAELHQHLTSEPYYNRGFLNCQLQTSHESRKFIALKLCNIHKRT